MKNLSKILTAFAAGAVAGAILGILFAPDKGSETRKKVDEQGRKLADDFKETIQKGKDKLNSLREDIQNKQTKAGNEFI